MSIRSKFIWLPAALMLLGVGIFARPARAQVWVDESQLHGRLPDWVDPKYYNPTVEPRYRTIIDCVWVEPVYRLVQQRVWREGGFEYIHERVWIEPKYEYREVVWYDECGIRHVRIEKVEITPGHWETVTRRVPVPGHWETIEVRELVTPGHWETIERQLPGR